MTNILKSFVILSVAVLSSCATSPVIEHEGHRYKVIEGRFEQFVKDLHWEKTATTGYTHVTTFISGWDITFDPEFGAASGIQARAHRTDDGLIRASIKFSVNDVNYNYGNPQKSVSPANYTAYLQEADEKIIVEFLGHFDGQDGIEYGEWEEFSIPLRQSFIKHLKSLKTEGDNDFVGDPIHIEFYREGFETIRFKILPSEILAAIHGVENGTICDPEYGKRGSRYTHLCPAIYPE